LLEKLPEIAKKTTSQIIEQTYVEYLPDGTKRDRYRKKYTPKHTKQQKEKTTQTKQEHLKNNTQLTKTQEKRTTNKKTPNNKNKKQVKGKNSMGENKQQNINQWHPDIPHTKIEHIAEEETFSAPANTTTTKYTSYRKDGVYEWSINTSQRITNRHLIPDIHRGEEFEW